MKLNKITLMLTVIVVSFLSAATFAAPDVSKDLLSDSLSSVKMTFGSGSVIWNYIYLLEVLAGGYAWHKTKHPGAVLGVVVLVLFVNFGIKFALGG
jgi:TraA.